MKFLENTTAFSEERILLIDLIDNVNKEEEETNDCENEATKLALKYNFVTDLTSLVIEEDDDYINKGPIEIGKKPRPAYHGNFASYASSQPFRRGPASGVHRKSASSYGVRSSLSSPAGRLTPLSAPTSLRASYSNAFASKGASKRNRNRNRPRRPSPTSPTTTTTTTQAPSTTTLGFCKITMYEQTYFRGSSVEITGDVSDFNDITFDNEIASLKIEGDCCWSIFTDSNFQGVSMNLNVGEYQSATNIRDVFKKASSAKNSC